MLIILKAKQAVKKFLFTFQEQGLKVALFRTKRKLVKVLTGKVITTLDEEIQQTITLEQPRPLTLNTTTSPSVSIIIPVYNNFLYTFNCLVSLRENISADVDFEVIVVDDCSQDETSTGLKLVSGIKVLRNSQNSGFIASCNRGAEVAQGQYLYFLNNDTKLLSNCLESLLALIGSNDSIAAVGSKLIYPNGKLQEAGGIIWRDASGWNYGRNDSPAEPEYNYVRAVDYCSGASLLVRRDIFQRYGGFACEFMPAYYEDTDLCFGLRDLGYKVLYQPQSAVVHYEGITSGTSLSAGVKQYQVVNYHKFEAKWRDTLARHFINDPKSVPKAARRLQGEKKILVIDSYVPLYDRESGCVRLMGILKIFLALGYSVIFLPDNGYPEEPYTSTLQQMGIEVVYCTPQQPDLKEQLVKRLPLVDGVWLCRPELCDKYMELIRYYSKAPIIYDTIDLHFLRLKRQQEFLDSSYQNTDWSWETYRKLEVNFARKADATTVVTDVEQKTLQYEGVNNVHVIPNIHYPVSCDLPPFEKRSGILFIGSYNHPPNIDAVRWLCLDIMPIIWQSHPEIHVTLLGSNLKEEVRELASDRVKVTGYVEDVEPYFLSHRVFVAPLRFGAGMKGKIGHSLSYGLPTVTTSIGAEGMGLVDRQDVLIGEDEDALARAVIELYHEQKLWEKLAQNSLDSIEKYSPLKVQQSIKNLLEGIGINLLG